MRKRLKSDRKIGKCRVFVASDVHRRGERIVLWSIKRGRAIITRDVYSVPRGERLEPFFENVRRMLEEQAANVCR